MDLSNQILRPPSRNKNKRLCGLFLAGKDTVGSRDFKAIERSFELANKDAVVIRLYEPEEGLKVMILKSIDFVVIDYSFFQDDQISVEFAQELKKRRKVPVLFVTRDERKLIAAYQQQLPFYEELDDYVTSPVDVSDFSKRFKRLISGSGRAAKRFDVKTSVQIERLKDSSLSSGMLLDLSLVGLGLKMDRDQIFRGEQLRIILRLRDFEYFHPQFGDLLKLAAKVRRVSLDGVTFGCSLEHMTPQQVECLSSILERLNRRQRGKAAQVRPQAV